MTLTPASPVPRTDEEIAEWRDALDEILLHEGPARSRELLKELLAHAERCGVRIQPDLNTPYVNTIGVKDQPRYPGDPETERRITAIVQWNAVAMVVAANRDNPGLGGHLSTYASTAELYEVGFQHFFRGGKSDADLVFFQAHAAPGVYARAFLEGRLSERQLANYRREVGGEGLSSYPHPRLMPRFWQFPTGSMGLGPLMAVYQARFQRYLEHRGLQPPSERRVWAFIGDGEMDEPESLSGLTLAAREELDNLTFVVNCNLQRLDGPVRGNGNLVQELERLFIGAGWNVIKVLWGSNWDPLFFRDEEKVIQRSFYEILDGDLQNYAAKDGAFNREQFFHSRPELKELVADLSDEDIDGLSRGGHDPVKIYTAYRAAVKHRGQPSVILALTKKGFGLRSQGSMSAHQQKRMDEADLRALRDRLQLPLSDAQAERAEFYRPALDSPEVHYLQQHRSRLGGFLPQRRAEAPAIQPPLAEAFADFAFKPGAVAMSTTVALVKMLRALLKSDSVGKRIVPIVADEARTFGMQSLFRQVGLYSHCGQLYEPEDRENLLYYRESKDGQILEEGIHEAGALASWIAAGTSYSVRGLPMLPLYIFYSAFGFRRVGDLIFAAADAGARGFLIGATSGQTTLSGEGLQHQDNSSHLVAATISSCRAYDPCYAYELAVIVEHGMRRMLADRADELFYLTVTNETYRQGPMPPGAEQGIVEGMYRVRLGDDRLKPGVQLLGSGAILPDVLTAAELLEGECQIAADVWSVTSFSELRRSALAAERANRQYPKNPRHVCWVERCMGQTSGPVVAATDYVRAVPDLIRAWIPGAYVTLGTDGFGRSDTRTSLRRFFEIDSVSIADAALSSLAAEGQLEHSLIEAFRKRHRYRPATGAPWDI